MSTPTADDLTTIDGIITALYDSISGPAELKRDLTRFRTLFAEGARLIPVRPAPDGSVAAQVLDVDEFFRIASENFKIAGFFEREIARPRTDTFGRITHVLSTYESLRSASDPQPFARGVNSIQLFHDGTRYHVVTIFWDFERPDNPIPAEYLPR
ncbi:MAG TPA: hypothetical protein VGV59_18020 [Pyrinomonadaceae bacterium]|nr:hypothetical protein [Pyrinomonadaceae bacterium]